MRSRLRDTTGEERVLYWTLLAVFLIFCFSSARSQGEEGRRSGGFRATHGVAVGEVEATGAVVWSRSNGEAFMHVLLTGVGVSEAMHRTKWVDASRDFAGKVRLDGLKPGTEYTYKVWFSASDTGKRSGQNVVAGRFKTPSAPDSKEAVTFAWGGDLGGTNVCRDLKAGYPIFDAINSLDLDFFIGLGDMIYGDGICEAVGRYGNFQIPREVGWAATVEAYWAQWRYNRDDSGFQKLLSGMPYYAIWDDHEVVNDFGPREDLREGAPYVRGQHLMPLGLKAFFDYNPIAQSPLEKGRLYRRIRWGSHLDLFFLDARQYRGQRSQPDTEDSGKSMLGKEQLEWFKSGLKESSATWKFIVSSVPMSIPTGWPEEKGRDGWANFEHDTGFERELIDILETMRQMGVRNVVWITTDVHFASGFRYVPFEEEPEFKVYEFISGPLSAGLYPNREYDKTLRPTRLFFYGPEDGVTVASFEEATRWMNFGAVQISRKGMCTVSIVNGEGKMVYYEKLLPRTSKPGEDDG